MRSDVVRAWQRVIGSGMATSSLHASRQAPSFRRLALLLAIVAAHVALLWWLAVLFAVRPLSRRVARGLTVIELAGSDGATPTPEQRVTRSLVRAPLPVAAEVSPVPAVVETSAMGIGSTESGAGVAGGGCAIALDIGPAIARDPAAMAELDALPAGMRSSADAVMLWNGAWLGADPGPAGTGGGALRRAVAAVISGAAPECRLQAMTGPQFVPVPDGNRTAMIVIGSGGWRWADLLPPDRSTAADRPAPASGPPKIFPRH